VIDRKFLIIAHRGESYDAPENSLASIKLAWERNVDAVEIDVRLTKDKKIVVIHDKTTLRTGRKFKRISSNNYHDLLHIDIGKFKGEKWKNERIPLLDEVLDSIPKNKNLFIELKIDTQIIMPLQKLIDWKKINSNQIKFIGFDINTMKSLKEVLPEFESYWIIEAKHYKDEFDLEETIKKCKMAKLDGLDVQEKKYLSRNIILKLKNADLKIYTWTVDEPQRAEQLYKDGIDGITTNRAFWLKNIFNEKKIF
jgi:glycerophosphoryl diester phosphodiesterase